MLTRIAVLLAIFSVSNVIYAGEPYSIPDERAASSAATQAGTDSTDKKMACEEEWRKYRESQACFAPYRLVNGGIKAEAFKHCTEIKQPEYCE